MSDIDAELRGLRDALEKAIPLPDVEHVTGRARARRRMQFGAIAAVVAVALAVPVLRALPTAMPPASPPDSPTTFTVDFADAEHGYALARSCKPGCEFALYRTTDGGRSWQQRELPPPVHPGSSYFGSTMFVLGRDNVVIDQLDDDQAWQKRIHSMDGGRTWQDVENWAPVTSAPLVPSGMVTWVCELGSRVGGGCSNIGSIAPDSGQTVTAFSQPPLGFKQIGAFATEGGKWWASGRHVNTNKWVISVSADEGRTWSTSELELDGIPGLDGWAVVERNGVMYATASTYRELLGVWRSTDDGRSWTRTWARRVGQELPGVLGMPIAAGDGTLLLPTGTTTYVSTDQGHTFKRTGDELFGMVTWTRAGYLRSNVDEFALSSDGLRWREFTVR